MTIRVSALEQRPVRGAHIMNPCASKGSAKKRRVSNSQPEPWKQKGAACDGDGADGSAHANCSLLSLAVRVGDEVLRTANDLAMLWVMRRLSREGIGLEELEGSHAK